MPTLVRPGLLGKIAGLLGSAVLYLYNWSRTDIFFNNTTVFFNDKTPKV